MTSTTTWLRRVSLLGGLAVLASSGACAAPTGDEETQTPDEPAATAQTEEELRDGSCRINGDEGKHYSFRDNRFRVCWVKYPGPFGSALSVYALRNASGVGRHLKVKLERWTDSKCYWVPNGALIEFQSADIKFVGEPQDVVGC